MDPAPAIAFREIFPGSLDYERALALREAVLRAPLGLRLSAEDLADELHCRHFGGFAVERLVAVLLLRRIDKQNVKMRQVAVHPDFQKHGVGSNLVAHAEGVAKTAGFTRMTAHARSTAVGFYRKAGYDVTDNEFIETTVAHRLVTKTL